MAALRRVRWSSVYVWIAVWLGSLTIPVFEQWHVASAHQGWDESTLLWTGIVDIALALGTVVLGFALGWQRRWAALWVAAVLGALAGSVAGWVASERRWSEVAGDPLPQPTRFLVSCVVLGLMLGLGAGMAALTRVARRHVQS